MRARRAGTERGGPVPPQWPPQCPDSDSDRQRCLPLLRVRPDNSPDNSLYYISAFSVHRSQTCVHRLRGTIEKFKMGYVSRAPTHPATPAAARLLTTSRPSSTTRPAAPVDEHDGSIKLSSLSASTRAVLAPLDADGSGCDGGGCWVCAMMCCAEAPNPQDPTGRCRPRRCTAL